MSPDRKLVWVGLISLATVLLVIGCGNREVNKASSSPEVAVVMIQPQRLVIATELTGRTSANQVAEVRPQVGGIIQKRLFTEGSDVVAGQVLYRIDPEMYQASLDNALAALGRSEANLPAIRLKASRLKELLAEKAVSQQDYDDAASALNQAEADVRYWKAAVETARINLKYTSVVAPIAGRIGKSNVTEGALVTANQATPLSLIQKIDPMYVDVPQSATDLLRLQRRIEAGNLNRSGRTRDNVRLFLEDNTPYPLAGSLQFRDITVDPTTGSVILRVVVPNPRGVLLPGMFLRAVVEEGVNQKALLIPQEAVMRNPKGEPYTLIVDKQNKVEQRMVTLDHAIGTAWLVSEGLVAGERVIVEGAQKVKPGVSVSPVPLADSGRRNETRNENSAKKAASAS